ncbi:BURP domain-containing protein 3 [Bienertia sinuspersici]
MKLNPNYKHPTEDEKDLILYGEDRSQLKPQQAHPPVVNYNSLKLKQVKKTQMPEGGRVLYFKNDKSFRMGAKMKLHFKKIDNEAKFLPLHVAKALPIASDKLQVILNLLSVNPKSILAEDIGIMMRKCEEKGAKDEDRHCVASMVAMVEYVTSMVKVEKNKLMAVSTNNDNGILMEYTIQRIQKLGSDDNHNVVCHKMSNPFAMFLCHNIKSTDIYGVSLVGVDGKQTKAIAVCHKDTSTWSPKHRSFQLLKSKLGGEPVCHFVNIDAIVWFSRQNYRQGFFAQA